MRDMVLVLNFDSHFGVTVARRLRGEHIYCKLVPKDITPAEVQAENPSGLILAGGVTGRSDQQRAFDSRLLEMGLPILALGSAARTLCEMLGGTRSEALVQRRAVSVTYAEKPLFSGLEAGERWIEHAHELLLPEGYESIVQAENCIVGFAHTEKPIFGLQFQIESNDPEGLTILSNYAMNICKCTSWWSSEAFIERAQEELLRVIGEGSALCSVTGGLDSTVCAALAHRTVQERLHCVLVDTGLLRQGEAQWIVQQLGESLGVAVQRVDVRQQVMEALRGVVDVAQKQALIKQIILETLEQEAARIGDAMVLLRGTNYSDIVLSLEAVDASALNSKLSMVEPLRDLFRDEVCRVGEQLELPNMLLARQPFPDAGLAVRVFGELTQQRLQTVRTADAILTEEIVAAGLDRKLLKYFAVLAQMPEGESEGQVVLLRAVQRSDSLTMPARLPYDLLERVVGRILKEVPDIARVVYDVTVSLNVQVEWE